MLKNFKLMRHKNTMSGNQSGNYSDDAEEASLGLSDDSEYGNGDSNYDNDVRNAELVFDEHHSDPFAVMRIQTYDDAPMAKGHVS
jgi:hypothetical protein